MDNKRWRPDGWNNPYEHIDMDAFIGGNPGGTIAVFEAGADAMLESLFKLANESPTGKFEIDSNIMVTQWRGGQ